MLQRLCLSWLVYAAAGVSASADSWKDWDYFAGRFIQDDGRVIDLTFDEKSTSEGQSYGLFFALVANDRRRFDAILRWTSDNLAGSQLGDRLPAWLWGRRDDGSWGVKDDNAASDGDAWLAYTLLEAGRLWNVPSYGERGRSLLQQIRRREVVTAGAAGPLLLPGPVGFALDGGRYRVDPSYVPGFMFRYFATIDHDGPWGGIWDSLVTLLRKPLAAGLAPDLFIVDEHGAAMPDTDSRSIGSYDAIRVYLWAGVSGATGQPLLKPLSRYAELTRRLGSPPEKVDTVAGTVIPSATGYSPIGFSGALLPYLSAIGDQQTLEQQRARIERAHLLALLGGSTNYYDQALILFGKGWLDRQFRFDEAGRLHPAWEH